VKHESPHTVPAHQSGNGFIFHSAEPFPLDAGGSLPSLDVAYTLHGTLNAEGTNAILVCHALTGHAHAADTTLAYGETINGWFNGLIGQGKALDTDRYAVICSNILGSCYGSTGPTSINPASGKPYAKDFPQMNVRDMVRAQKLLLDRLGVKRLVTVIGGSLGGMQTLEWGALYPDMVQSVIPIATSAKHSAWCIGISETQRLAIMSDAEWRNGDYIDQPARGLAIARAIAMLWYRSQPSFEERFGGRPAGSFDGSGRTRLFRGMPMHHAVESYLRYQGQKLVDRFDANSYIVLTRAMDLHDLGAGRGGVDAALRAFRPRLLGIGISSDILYPPHEQQFIAASVPNGRYVELDSPFGHDAFLMEFDAMNRIVGEFLESTWDNKQC
jgi:homoserine O-acetyltransferase/O-succinyltransferase